MRLLGGLFLALVSFKNIASASLKSFSDESGSTVFEKGVNLLNPKEDPVYDPETKECHFELSPEHKFTVPVYHAIESALKLSSSAKSPSKSLAEIDLSTCREFTPASGTCFSPVSELSFSADSLDATVTEPYSPSVSFYASESASPSTSNYRSFDHYHAFPYIPVRCRGYERKWDFYLGSRIDGDSKRIAWISRIGFAENVILDLGLSTHSCSYTLLPYCTPRKSSLLGVSLFYQKYVDIVCDGNDLFRNLFSISSKIDSFFIKFFIAVNIRFDKHGIARIRIYIKHNHDIAMRRILTELNPNVVDEEINTF